MNQGKIMSFSDSCMYVGYWRTGEGDRWLLAGHSWVEEKVRAIGARVFLLQEEVQRGELKISCPVQGVDKRRGLRWTW